MKGGVPEARRGLRFQSEDFRYTPTGTTNPSRAASLERLYRARTRGPRRAVMIRDNVRCHRTRICKDGWAQRADGSSSRSYGGGPRAYRDR